MNQVGLSFQIKRGVVDRENIDTDLHEVFDQCLELCKKEKYEDAVRYLLPKTYFEWIWGNCDGDPSEDFDTVREVGFDCNVDNCSLRLGNDGDCLVMTLEVSFEIQTVRQIDEDKIQKWIDDKALWSCGYIGAGWSYVESDGDNVWLMSIDGKPAGMGKMRPELDED